MVDPKYDIEFLDDAFAFLEGLDAKAREKVIYNMDKSRYANDPKLFKKLTGDIWEFRTKYAGLQYRLFAFWDRSRPVKTLVIATHGIVKKTDKVPEKEIARAIEMKKRYTQLLNSKKMRNKSINTYMLAEVKDKFIGRKGTKRRNQYELELNLELLGEMIKTVRKERHLTQDQLGKLVGVQKSQISKLENNTTDVRLDTVLKLFSAMKANVCFNVKLEEGFRHAGAK